MALADRVRNIIVQPAQEWPVIAMEPATPGSILTGYVLPLALIPSIASAIQFIVFHHNLIAAVVTAVLGYILAVVGVYILAFIVDALAPSFNGQKNMTQAMKLVAYAQTPAWIAGILNIVPILGLLAIVAGLYGLYLLYLGVQPVIGVPQDKSVGFVVVVILVAIVVNLILSAIVGFAVAALVVGSMATSGALH